MSHDQRPGRVRVFSSGTPADTPRRRRTDPKPVPAPPRIEDLGGTSAPSRSAIITLTLLFVGGCAVGSGLIAVYGIAGLLGR